MTLLEIILLAIALSVDASIVSFTQGTILHINKRKYSFLLALFMALFQAFMPIIGWYAARSVYVYIKAYDHWLALIVFMVLGIKLIYDAIKEKQEGTVITCLSMYCILMLSLATSIDAMVAGATLAFLDIEVIKPAIIIGITTFIGSLAGFWCGYLLKKLNKTVLGIIGGIILILLGVKVFVEHVFLHLA